MAISNLLTGRVRVVSPKNVTSDRYEFLDLSQAEPNLGVPNFSASLLTNPAIVVSDDQGNRGFAKKLFLEEFSGSFSGSFQGDGSRLTNVPAVIAPFIASGSFTASFGDNGLNVNTNTAVSGNLNVLGDATVAGNLYVSKSIIADQLIVNIISSSVIYSSGSNIFGDEITDIQQFTGSVGIRDFLIVNEITASSIAGALTGSFRGQLEGTGSVSGSFLGQIEATGSFKGKVEASGSFTGSFTGSYFGDGRDLFNLPVATKLATGSVTASVSPDYGFKVISAESGSEFTGSINVTGSVIADFFIGDGSQLINVPSTVAPRIASGSVTASVSPDYGLLVFSPDSGSTFTGSIYITGSVEVTGSITAFNFYGSASQAVNANLLDGL